MSTTFLDVKELDGLGLGACGKNVLISRNATLINVEQIFLGDHVRIDDFALISAGQPVTAGRYVHIGAGAQIFGTAGCTLGDFVSVSPRAAIFTTNDDFSGESLVGPTIPARYRSGLSQEAVVINDYACIATNATVMPGVVMQEGSVCGAHALVRSNCEPWSIYAGVPAARIKARSQKAKLLGEACRAD
jgi:acetyltransferase-like isoleucine patch superfamily enzyme